MNASSTVPGVGVPEALAIYGYSEKLYHLPGYDPMSHFLKNMNGFDRQLPTLASSPSQPAGIYYVDNSSNLDVLYLNNSTVRTIAHIVPLYQLYGYNEMLDNEFFLEYNYDEALFFGTTAANGETYSIEIVNLTTGSMLMWNTTFPVDRVNQEAIYVGNHTVIVLSSSDTIVGFNLASHETWSAGTTSYFEANNIYWIPQLNQLINVEAGGSRADQVDQLNASVDSLGHVKFSITANLTVDSDVRFDFVNGIGYNASLRQLAFSAGRFQNDSVYTYVLQYQPSYVLSKTLAARYSVLPLGTSQLFSGQRYVYTSEYVLGGILGGIQYLFDPWSGATVATNRTFQEGVACSNACFEGEYAASQNYMLDYNASLTNESSFYNVVYAYHGSQGPSPGSSEVTFTETGLPSGSPWHLDLTHGSSFELTAASVTLDLPNGTYTYTVAAVDRQYEPLPASGKFVVAGAALSESVTFSLVTYAVTYAEQGLPLGTAWSLNISDGPAYNSTGSTMAFVEPNGTYGYEVATTDSEYAPTPRVGAFVVSGATVNGTAAFGLVTYNVTFTEQGLPSGTTWTVTLNRVEHGSTTPTISFAEPNGTYSFSVGTVAGYLVNLGAGSLAVNGSANQRSVTFAATFLGLPATEGYAALGAAVLATLVTLVVIRRNRRRGRSRRPPLPPSAEDRPPAVP